MALILNIDTATETAGICLAKDGKVLGTAVNESQQDHASWLQPAVSKLVLEARVTMQQLDAVAVTIGPGSYTGLRVGLASAKGLCYALKIPLITESTLKTMAFAAVNELFPLQEVAADQPILICPMIDARRMEVFTGVYDTNLEEKMPESALILEKNSFAELLEKNAILFIGNGSPKWKPICGSSNAYYVEKALEIAPNLALIAEKKYREQQFSDLAYTEPAYLKEFYTYIKK
ncbi:MAG: tRNA (adenosine(37)-N6)-threonylcarbamoyltransferase complex dimerization subunit type 1 TsaB [Chitinophagaceae bacterium]